MIQVFYDGGCGLCRREIDYYQRLAPTAPIDWIDIIDTPERCLELGITPKDAMRFFHVHDHLGKIHIGAKGFIILWRHLPGFWPILARLINLPVILPITEFCYRRFAVWRFKKRTKETCIL